MPPGASWFDLLAKQTTNTLEAASCYGFERATLVPDPPLLRTKYIVPAGSTGDWAGHDNEIAIYDPANHCWVFYSPVAGQQANMPDGDILVFNGVRWAILDVHGGGVTQDNLNALESALKTYADDQDAALKTYVDEQDSKLQGQITDLSGAIGTCPCELLAKKTYTIYSENADYKTLYDAFEALKGKRITVDNPVTLKIPAGIHYETKGVKHSSAQEGLRIQGVSTGVQIKSITLVKPEEYTVTAEDNWKAGTPIPFHKVNIVLANIEVRTESDSKDYVYIKLKDEKGNPIKDKEGNELEEKWGQSKDIIGQFLLVRDVIGMTDKGNPAWPLFNANASNDDTNSPDGENNSSDLYEGEDGSQGTTTNEYSTDALYQEAWENFTTNKIPLYALCGAHEIIGITPATNTITVLLYNRVAPPKIDFGDKPLNATVVRSVIRYVPEIEKAQRDAIQKLETNRAEATTEEIKTASGGGVSAFILESGGYLGTVDNVAFVGRCRPYYLDSSGTPTKTLPTGLHSTDFRGPYDYQEPVNYYGFLARQNTKFTFGKNAVISGFCGNCLLVQGSGLFQGFAANSWGQNIGIGSGGSVRLVDCVSHGSWLDGGVVQDGGELTCQRCYFIGNARSGYIFSQGSTTGANSYIVAVYNGTRRDADEESIQKNDNLTDAEKAKALGQLYKAGGNAAGIVVYGDAAAIQSLVAFNQWHGIIVSAGAQANLRNSHVFNNRRYGAWVLNGADAIFQDSSFYNNGLDNEGIPKYFDMVVRNNATATLANVFGRDSTLPAMFSPTPNSFGRTGGYIAAAIDMPFYSQPLAPTKDDPNEYPNGKIVPENTQYITSFSLGTTIGNVRDLTVWKNGVVLVGGETKSIDISTCKQADENTLPGNKVTTKINGERKTIDISTGTEPTDDTSAENEFVIPANGNILGGIRPPGTYSGSGNSLKMEVQGALACTDLLPLKYFDTPNNSTEQQNTSALLGTDAHRWDGLYCKKIHTEETISIDSATTTSDWRTKDQIEVSPLGLSFINRLTPVKYKWLDYTEVKRKYRAVTFKDEHGNYYEKNEYIGDEAVNHTFSRPHYGLLSQQLKEAFTAEGQADCAAYIKANNDYEGIRYSELIAPLIRAVQELSIRIEALEKAANIQPAEYTLPDVPEYDLPKRTTVEHPIEEVVRQIDAFRDETEEEQPYEY